MDRKQEAECEQPVRLVKRNCVYYLTQLLPKKGNLWGVFFFFGYHFLNISLLLNETHGLKKSNQDKTVVDCPFRLKTEDFKDGEKIHWVKFF